MRVALIESIEKEIKSQCPNLAYGLFKNDLEEVGHHCDIIRLERKTLFSTSKAYQFYKFLISKKYDLIGLNTFSAQNLIKVLKRIIPKSKIIVGGLNSISFINQLYDGHIDYICHGPGRNTIVKLAEAIEQKKVPYHVPNLIFKKKDKIVHSKKIELFNIEKETHNFWPRFESIDLGFQEPNIKYSIIGNIGCPYKKSVEKNPYYKDVEYFFDFDLDKCDETLKSIIQNHIRLIKIGCSFCTISSDKSYLITEKTRKKEIILNQIHNIKELYGSANLISLIDEAPLGYIEEVIKELEKEDNKTNLRISSRVDHLLNNQSRMERILNQLQRVTLILGLVGFENFSQKELDIFNKGITEFQNIEAIRYIKKLKKFSKNFKTLNNFGIILFNPWTNIEDLRKNIRVFEQENFVDYIAGHSILRELIIHEDTAIYFKALKEGLVQGKRNTRGGLIWNFKDKRVEEVYRKCKKTFTRENLNINEQLKILKKEVNKHS